MGAAERDPLVETAEHDGPAGGVYLFNPPHRAARHEDTGDPRNHKQQPGDRNHGRLDLVRKAVEFADIPSHQQTIAAWKCLEHRPYQRPVCRVGQRPAGAKLRPSASCRDRRRPCLEVAGERSERCIDENIDVICKALVGDALFDQGDQTVAARSFVGGLQIRNLRHDGAIRSAAHIGRGGEIDVAEQRRHDQAEGGDRDQRQLERR